MGIHYKDFLADIIISILCNGRNQFNVQKLSDTVSKIIEKQLLVADDPKIVLMHSSQQTCWNLKKEHNFT